MDLKNIMQQLGSNPQIMQMQQKMKQAYQDMHKRHETETISASSGGDMVKATVTIKGSLVSLDISEDLLKEGSAVVSEMVVAAVNLAKDKAATKSQEDMSKLAAELGLPSGFGGF